MAASSDCSVGLTSFICQVEFRLFPLSDLLEPIFGPSALLVLICFSDLTWRIIVLKECTTAGKASMSFSPLCRFTFHCSAPVRVIAELIRRQLHAVSCLIRALPKPRPTSCPAVLPRRSHKIRSQYEGALDFASEETCQTMSKMRAGELKWARQALKRIGHGVAVGQGRFVSGLRSQSGSTISRLSPCSALCQAAWSSYWAR